MALNFGIGLLMIPVILFMFLLPIALLVALQAWLCKKSLKLGLILPGLSLALSLMMVFSMGAFSALTFEGGKTLVSGGASYVGPAGPEVPAQEENYTNVPAQEGVPKGETEKTELPVKALLTLGAVFLVTNIPTAVFGGIWLHYKGRRDTVEDLKRMKIEDLG